MNLAPAAIPTVNAKPIPVADVPVVGLDDFRQHLREQLAPGSAALLALFGVPAGPHTLRIYGLTSVGATGEIGLLATDVGDRYPSLTQHITQAHWFERELAEQWGVVPEDHPWLKPIRFHRSYREGQDAWSRSVGDRILPCVQPKGTDYFKIRGDEIHEVAVGPVHAGVIEPGHFRFQCHGEHVFTLEIELGYQHRGIERPPGRRARQADRALHGNTRRRHLDRTRLRVLPAVGRARGHRSARAGSSHSCHRLGTRAFGEPHGGSGRRWRATWATCRRCLTAGGSAVIS